MSVRQHTVCHMLFKTSKSYCGFILTCDLLQKPGTSEAARKTANKGLPKAHIMDVSMAKVQT